MKKGVLLLLWAFLPASFLFGQTIPAPGVQWTYREDLALGNPSSSYAIAVKAPVGIIFFGYGSGNDTPNRTNSSTKISKFTDGLSPVWKNKIYTCANPKPDYCGYPYERIIATNDGGALLYSPNGKGMLKVDKTGERLWESNLISSALKIAEGISGIFYILQTKNFISKLSADGKTVLGSFQLANDSVIDISATSDGGLVYTGPGGTHKIEGSSSWDNPLYANNIRENFDGSFTAWGSNGIVRLSKGGLNQWTYDFKGINDLTIGQNGDVFIVSDFGSIGVNADGTKKWEKTSSGIKIIQTTDGSLVIATNYFIRKRDFITGEQLWETPGPIVQQYGFIYSYGLVKADDGGFYQYDTGGTSSGYAENFLRKYAADPCTVTATITTTTTTICKGGSLTLNANTGAGLTYQWKRDGQTLDGATAASYTATQAGSYTVTVSQTGTSCVVTSAAVTVVVSDPKVNPVAGSTEFCAGGSTALSASATGGTGAYSFQWKLGQTVVGTGPTFNTGTAGDYTVTATDANTCPATPTTVSVKVNPPPTANPGPDVSRTGTEKLTIGGTTASGGAPGYTYAWSADPAVPIDNPTAANPTFGPFTTSTKLTLTVTDGKGCTASKSALVVYAACTFNAIVSSKGYLCRGGSDTLRVQLTGGNGNFGYSWKLNGQVVATTDRLVATQPGTYAVEVEDGKGCRAASNQVSLSESPIPTVGISGENTFCKGSNTTLTANASGGTGPYSFQWTNGGAAVGATNPLSASAAGTYTATAIDARGCRGMSPTLTVSEKGGDIPAQVSSVGPTEVFTPNTITLNASAGLGYSYQWRKNGQDLAGATTASYVVNQPGTATYAVAVSREGCTVVSASVSVNIILPTGLEPVNSVAFTVEAFPNPTTGFLRVEITQETPHPLTLRLTDLTGRVVQENQTGRPEARHTVEWNVNGLVSGLYLLLVRAGEQRWVQKVAKID